MPNGKILYFQQQLYLNAFSHMLPMAVTGTHYTTQTFDMSTNLPITLAYSPKAIIFTVVITSTQFLSHVNITSGLLQGELNKEVTYWMDGSVASILVTLNNNIITFATNTAYITGKNITLIIF